MTNNQQAPASDQSRGCSPEQGGRAAVEHGPETHRLVVQSNGWIVVETRGDRFVRTSPARDLVYRLQYKSTQGWWEITGEFHDDMTARQCLREANPRIQWRLIASNEFGVVAIPKGWEGPRS